jgi:hypothetical protein
MEPATTRNVPSGGPPRRRRKRGRIYARGAYTAAEVVDALGCEIGDLFTDLPGSIWYPRGRWKTGLQAACARCARVFGGQRDAAFQIRGSTGALTSSAEEHDQHCCIRDRGGRVTRTFGSRGEVSRDAQTLDLVVTAPWGCSELYIVNILYYFSLVWLS